MADRFDRGVSRDFYEQELDLAAAAVKKKAEDEDKTGRCNDLP